MLNLLGNMRQLQFLKTTAVRLDGNPRQYCSISHITEPATVDQALNICHLRAAIWIEAWLHL